MVTIFIGMLAVAWISVGALVVVERRREGKADSSVVSFRNQLSTLERATPGTMMRQSLTGPVPVVTVDAVPARPQMSPMQRRRRDVLIGLAGTAVFTLLLVVLMPGMLSVLLFLAASGSLGAYVYLLRQFHLRSQQRSPQVAASSMATPELNLVSSPGVRPTATILPRSFAN